MFKRKPLFRVLGIAAAFAALLPAAAHAATTLVINAFLPPPHVFNTKVLKPWAADVEKATDGRVKIMFPPNSVAAPNQLWNSVKNSIVDGAYLFNGNIENKLHLPQLAHLPLGSTTSKAMSIALWRTYDKYFKQANEYREVQLLALFVFPGGHIYGMKGPVNSPQALQGLRMWALPGVPARMMEAAKAGVVATPAAKMSEIVAGGTVDAFAGIPEMDVNAFKVGRYATAETVVPGALSAPSFSLIINKQKWQSISAADRAAIMKLSGESFAKRMGVVDQVNQAARTALEKEGVKSTEASPQLMDELKKLAAPLDQAWIAEAGKLHVDGKAALDYYRAQAKEAEHDQD